MAKKKRQSMKLNNCPYGCGDPSCKITLANMNKIKLTKTN